jgi:GntR family transcriptional regulator, rspAB operon transcriptional repressor
MIKPSIKKDITMRKKVYKYLREQILNGLIRPDEHILETKIAKEIGASRTPVREALHSLELERLVISRPSVGYVVRIMSEEEVMQTCEIRKRIENLAILWAMEKAPKKLIENLRKNIAATEAEVKKGNIKKFIELDARFHEIISTLSGSEQLLEMSQLLRRQMLRYRTQSIYQVESVLKAVKGHKRLLKAIEDGDQLRIEEAIYIHLDESKEDILHHVFEMADTA